MRVLPEIRPRASTLGWNESSSAACCTRRRVAGATSSRALSALEAVATETPASLATSVRVTCARFLLTGKSSFLKPEYRKLFGEHTHGCLRVTTVTNRHVGQIVRRRRGEIDR